MENQQPPPDPIPPASAPEAPAPRVTVPDPLANLSPTVRSILSACDLQEMAPSLCLRCQEATVLQLSSPDGAQNSCVIQCHALNRDIQVIVARCTSHKAFPQAPKR